MAGSRKEALGSVFARLTGLMRSGALKPEDRPIWYDVVKALPPKPLPPQHEIQKIAYPEDIVRVHFNNTFVERTPTVLTNEKSKSVSERFVDTYLEFCSKKGAPPEEIFNKTVDLLKAEGVLFQTFQEKEEIDLARRKSISTQPEKQAYPDNSYTGSISKVDAPIETIRPPKSKTPQVKVDLDKLYSEDK